MLVAVGTKNEVKTKAVEEAFRTYFDEVYAIGVEVDSGVPPQPFDEEILAGAKNRAEKALGRVDGARFGVGIESGLTRVGRWVLSKSAVYIVGSEGEVGFSLSAQFPLPHEVADRVLKGEEMGKVVDEVFGVKGAKFAVGAVGLLTRGAIDRKELYRHAVILALVPVINRHLSWV